MAQKKIAIIGLGNIAARHLKNIKTLYPDMQTIAVSSSGRKIVEPVENIDKVTTIEGLASENIDYAIVSSPATFHERHLSCLLKFKVPVFIEKPVAADIQGAEKIGEMAKWHNARISIGYCLRFMPALMYVKQCLEQQHIGNVLNVDVSVGQYLPGWRKSKDYKDSVSVSRFLGGGVLLELSHELDYLQWLFGELRYKFAILRNTSELDIEVEEIADLVLEAGKGIVCNVHLDFIQKQPQRHCSFIGSLGRIEWDLIENTIYLYKDGKKECIYAKPDWDRNEMYLDMLSDFILPAEKNNSLRPYLDESIKIVKLIETIKHQAVWGAKI